MRASNKLVREWLLSHDYTHIWFKAHTNRSDKVFTNKGSYLASDLWNLFDGIAIRRRDERIYFLQMQTNSWANEKHIKFWTQRVVGVKVLSFNVNNIQKETKGKWTVLYRGIKI